MQGIAEGTIVYLNCCHDYDPGYILENYTKNCLPHGYDNISLKEAQVAVTHHNKLLRAYTDNITGKLIKHCDRNSLIQKLKSDGTSTLGTTSVDGMAGDEARSSSPKYSSSHGYASVIPNQRHNYATHKYGSNSNKRSRSDINQ